MLVSGVWQSDFSYTYTCFTENFLKVTNAGGSTEKILNFTGIYIKPQRSLSVSMKSLKKCLFFFNWIIPLLRIYFKKIILNIEKIHRGVYCSIFFLWLQGTGNSLATSTLERSPITSVCISYRAVLTGGERTKRKVVAILWALQEACVLGWAQAGGPECAPLP